jgi:hypothetical protein
MLLVLRDVFIYHSFRLVFVQLSCHWAAEKTHGAITIEIVLQSRQGVYKNVEKIQLRRYGRCGGGVARFFDTIMQTFLERGGLVK